MTEIILESISDGVFTVDLNWVITSFNRAAEEITGIKRHNAIGAFCYEVFKSNMCEEKCPLRRTIVTGNPVINESGFIVNLQGEKIPISVSTALLIDNSGKIIGGAETFRDLSELENLKSQLNFRYGIEEMQSNSLLMANIFEVLPAFSNSDSTILIEGETGTGKELIARTIHKLSKKKAGPFVALNCAALPDSLLESELFGYKKGAFTGADRDKPGRFALAENGTLFLDEIGDISQNMQVKLLRVLQERLYEPLGSVKTKKTNARILCASNKKLKSLVEKNKFRQDLYFRINVLNVEIPPLRKRKEDIPIIAEHLLKKYNILMNKRIDGFTEAVYSVFYKYNWPGNIRELENIIERAVVLCSDKTIDINQLPAEIIETKFSDYKKISCLEDSVKETERICILQALNNNNYNRTKAAKELKIDKATFYRKIKKLRIFLTKR